jgi:hypothetical protein
MGSPLSIAFIVVLLIPLWVLLGRDYIKGVAYAVFLCVSMSTYLRIPMPGSLPQLTIFRLVLIILFIFWRRHRNSDLRFSSAPLYAAFCLWALADLASLLFTSGDFVVGLKRYLDFVVEAAVFFFLLITSFRSREDVMRVISGACLGVTLVAAIAFVEKYTGHTPVSYIEPANPESLDLGQAQVRHYGDVVSTYQHRILLGTGMAMGFPLAFALMLHRQKQFRKPAWLWLALLLMIAACYFSNSRGPWLAAVLSGGVLLTLGTTVIRKKLAAILGISIIVLAARPGILVSWTHDFEATEDAQSLKGGTFRYRLELWKVAWAEISTSPERLLFGCGPGCGFGSTVDWKLSYRGGQEWQIWSWDNHLAYDLYQSGVMGLAASLGLYGSVLLAACRLWKSSRAGDRNIFCCLLASLIAYTFMLTNILMFTKPVNFLFWTVAAASCGLGLSFREEHEAALDQDAQPGTVLQEPELLRAPLT